MGLTTGYPIGKIWAERFRWLWPYYLAYGVVAYTFILGYAYIGPFGVLVILVPLLSLRFSQTQYINHTKGIVRQLRRKNTELENHTEEITILNEELLLALSHIVDLRDPYVFGHSQQVTRYATQIGQQLGLTGTRMENLRKAALLHDLGKIGIPEEILFKPARLSAEEYEIVKTHAGKGAEILETVHSLHPLIPIVRHHHERFDGRGYPDGLKGQSIPLEARILCLADSLEAMASDRPYRRALSREEILQEIHVNAGRQFDPVVVDAFLKVLVEQDEGFIINSARFLAAEEMVMDLDQARVELPDEERYRH
jgi:putative nucleotidyltransferase with HDIG domain